MCEYKSINNLVMWHMVTCNMRVTHVLSVYVTIPKRENEWLNSDQSLIPTQRVVMVEVLRLSKMSSHSFTLCSVHKHTLPTKQKMCFNQLSLVNQRWQHLHTRCVSIHTPTWTQVRVFLRSYLVTSFSRAVQLYPTVCTWLFPSSSCTPTSQHLA